MQHYLSAVRVGIALALGACALCLANSANAGWPSGQDRTIAGQGCTPFTIRVDPYDTITSLCPYVSDYSPNADSYYALSNSIAYADYHVSSAGSGRATYVSACRQSWTGSAASCGSSGNTSGTGFKDLGVNGFSYISGSTSTDYYYVEIDTTETIDEILGVYYG